MAKLFLFCAVLSALLFSNFAFAQENFSVKTGNDLIGWCRSAIKMADGASVPNAEGVGAALCMGYLRGAHEAPGLFMSEAQRTSICFPKITDWQSLRVVLKYLESHPEKLHEPAAQLTWNAWMEAFPCHSK